MMKSRRSWSDKEDEAFAKLTKEYEPKNWAVIAKRLACEFGFKRRSGKQCRERWYNHLVPGISKKVWSKAEEDKLLLLHKNYGNKWTIIAEHMPGRTDNSIKNYFYSTVRRSLRRMGKLIGSKNSTSLMRSIKPSTLTHIFSVLSEDKPEAFHEDFKEQFQTLENLKISCENVRDQIIQFSSYKPKRTDEIDENQRKRYERVFQIILKLNDIYQRMKGFQKNSKSQEEIFREGFKQMMKQASEDDSSAHNEELPNSDQSSDEEMNAHLITNRTTRTRKIKVPQKLISILPPPQANQRDACVEKEHADGNDGNLMILKEDNFQPQLKIVINSPQFEDLIGDDYSDPHFQIQLKDEVSNFQNLNVNFNAFQKSPNFYFGTPRDRVNYFKSPLAISCLPKDYFFAAVNAEDVARDPSEAQKIEHKNTDI